MQELLWQQKGVPGLQGRQEWDEVWPVLTSAETLPKVCFSESKMFTFLHQKAAFLVHFW